MSDEYRLPVKHGTVLSAVLFAVAAIVVSIAVAFVLVRTQSQETRGEIAKVQTQVSVDTTRLANQLVEAERTQGELKRELAAVNERAAKLENEKDELAKKLSGMAGGFEKFATDFGKFAKGQESLDRTQNTDLVATNVNVKKLEDRVRYIDDKLKRIDEIERDVLGLKNDSGVMHEEFKTLRADMRAVRSKSEITEKDVADLSDRARVFQLRVLAARAREAADAARKADLDSLLNKLDEVEEK